MYDVKQYRKIADSILPMPSRDFKYLHPYVNWLFNKLIVVCRQKYNIEVSFNNLVRSWKYQDSLYAQGRTVNGVIVTNAKGGFSMHNFGLAGDFFIAKYPGQTKTSGIYPAKYMSLVIKEARALGLVSGSDWGDNPHLQWQGGRTEKQIYAGTNPIVPKGAVL